MIVAQHISGNIDCHRNQTYNLHRILLKTTKHSTNIHNSSIYNQRNWRVVNPYPFVWDTLSSLEIAKGWSLREMGGVKMPSSHGFENGWQLIQLYHNLAQVLWRSRHGDPVLKRRSSHARSPHNYWLSSILPTWRATRIHHFPQSYLFSNMIILKKVLIVVYWGCLKIRGPKTSL